MTAISAILETAAIIVMLIGVGLLVLCIGIMLVIIVWDECIRPAWRQVVWLWQNRGEL
jgi:hypothetical protein